MRKFAIDLPLEEIKSFCLKWEIKEFSLFGSVLREDFDLQKSDIDTLVLFDENAKVSIFGIVEMKEELESIFKRKVDIVSKKGIEKSRNPYRKKAILEDYEVIYDQAA